MTYQLAKVALKSFNRIVSDTAPMYVDLSPITGNDASFLRVSAVVDNVAGIGAGALALEHSPDGGVTWVAVTAVTTTAITIAGTYTIETTAVSGVLSPNVRVLLTAGAGFAYSLSNLYKTYSDGPIIPTAALGGATEATLLLVEGHVSTIDTNVGLIEGHVSTIDTNVGLIEGHISTVDTNVGLIEGHISTVDTNVGTITTDVGTIKTDVGLIEGHISTVDTNVGLIEGHISTVDTNIGTMTTDIGLIKNALAAPVGVQRSLANAPYTRAYASSNLPASPTWTQIVAATTLKATKVEVFDSSGEFLELAVGAGGGEVTQFVIFPGGNGPVEILIPINSRVSIRPLATSAITVGSLAINFYT